MEPSAFTPVCAVEDLPNGGRRTVELATTSVLLVNLGGRILAVRNRCTHLDAPLADGRLIGERIICRRHGASYSLVTGRPTGGPAVFSLETFQTRVRDGQIELGASAGGPCADHP
jgi:3-phenylpropionate/trans-cinnamate dioxygenase ferredoxin subunit